MAQYMLNVHSSSADYDIPMEEAMPMYEAVGAFNNELQASGQWVFGAGLQRVETATVVDGTGADAVVTDGPYLETKEYLGGFWIIDVPDLDAALKVAADASKACQGKVEIRPLEGA